MSFSQRMRRNLVNKIDCIDLSTRDTTFWASTKLRLEVMLNFCDRKPLVNSNNNNFQILVFERNTDCKATPGIAVDIRMKSDNIVDYSND